MTNINRTYGNNIIVGTKDGVTEYYNWKQDKMVADKDQATGYHSKQAAKGVINQIKTEIPGYTWTTSLDTPKK